MKAYLLFASLLTGCGQGGEDGCKYLLEIAADSDSKDGLISSLNDKEIHYVESSDLNTITAVLQGDIRFASFYRKNHVMMVEYSNDEIDSIACKILNSGL